MIMVVRSGACLGFGIMLGGALKDSSRRLDGWLGRLQDGVLTECPPCGREGVEAAPAGIFVGRLRCMPVLERGAEDFPLGLQVADPGAHLTDLLACCRLSLLVVGVAEGCGFGGAQRLDFLVGVASA